jgi:flavin-dependent dehydrogenase
VLFDRATFPRHKVCGDCLNPHSWRVFERLELVEQIRALPQEALQAVEFRNPTNCRVLVNLPNGAGSEIAIERRLLDAALLDNARNSGVEVLEGRAVTGVERTAKGWQIRAQEQLWIARALVGADGRNSTVARMAGRLPSARKGRVAVQAHLPRPDSLEPHVCLWLYAYGYAGICPINETTANVCVVGQPSRVAEIQRQILSELGVNAKTHWHTVAPLARRDAVPASDGLFLVGDAARVVEPFTGEGTYYAMRTGELAAMSIIRWLRGELDQSAAEAEYIAQHKACYRGRFWVNQLARLAVTVPSAGSTIIRAGSLCPALLCGLTRKVISPTG